MCQEFYQLDPLRFYITPGLPWYAGLKMTGVTCDLFTDAEQYLFIEVRMRGGISLISQRYAKANHPSIPGR